jgi:hypothetical protein
MARFKKWQFKTKFVERIGTISTGAFQHQIRPETPPSENGSWVRACPATAPLLTGILHEEWSGKLLGVQVRFIIRQEKNPVGSTGPVIHGLHGL